jgi:hypothetical protein
MKKLGMTKKGEFNHPSLINHPEYEKHFCYGITNPAKAGQAV